MAYEPRHRPLTNLERDRLLIAICCQNEFLLARGPADSASELEARKRIERYAIELGKIVGPAPGPENNGH